MINTTIDNTYNSIQTDPKNELVGGRNQEWKQTIENICQKHLEQKTTQKVVEEMGETKQNIRKIHIMWDKKMA